MQRFKVLTLLILVTTIVVSCSSGRQEYSYEGAYGWYDRHLSSREILNCVEDKLAIYTENEGYLVHSTDFIIGNLDLDLGIDEFSFILKFENIPENVLSLKHASISLCINGKLYHGRGQIAYSSNRPAACHFYYRLNENGEIIKDTLNSIVCFSQEFISPDRYAKEVLGINNE